MITRSVCKRNKFLTDSEMIRKIVHERNNFLKQMINDNKHVQYFANAKQFAPVPTCVHDLSCLRTRTGLFVTLKTIRNN